MGSDYSVLIESKDSLEVVKEHLERIINFPLQLVKEWEYFEMYSVQVMGLWIQLHEFRKLGEPTEKSFLNTVMKLMSGFLGNLIDPSNGRSWTQATCVELARIFTRNMMRNTAVVKNYVVTHEFSVE